MTQIPAAEHIVIDLLPESWQLREENNPNPMAAATANGLHYSLRFGMTRRLPEAGQLPPSDILQVVLGWQKRDQAWHLGLVVGPELAQMRNSRWCELAYWVDPAQTSHRQAAQAAGTALGDMLNVPFQMIPPKDAPETVQPQLQPPPLPDLPLAFGLWSMRMVKLGEQTVRGVPVGGRQLLIVRSSKWALTRVTRMMWYGFWAIVYTILSIATLTSDLALPNAGTLLPNPQLLPYFGLATAAVLVLLVLYNLYDMLTRYNVIIVDPDDASISAWRKRRMKWRFTGADVKSVYVSELVKKRSDDPTTEHGEINLQIGDKQFQFVLQQGDIVSNENAPDDVERPRRTNEVIPLRRGDAHTDLQAAAQYIADTLGDLPVWYDMRVK